MSKIGFEERTKGNMKGQERSAEKKVGNLCPLIRETGESPELQTVADIGRWMNRCEQTGLMHIKSVLDSGATDSCAPHEMCPEVPSQPSEGSRRGQSYTTAGGKKIKNEGEKNLSMVTEMGEMVGTNWQTVDITRPSTSVRQICQQGNRVAFGAQGGVILNLETGKETHLRVEDNVYVLDLWLPRPASGFGRPG